MAVETATDRAALFGINDFGVTATYSRGVTTSSVIGIFDNLYVTVDIAEVGYASAEPEFLMQSSQVPSGAVQGDTLTIDATAYIVRNIEPDGTGVTRLRLQAPA